MSRGLPLADPLTSEFIMQYRNGYYSVGRIDDGCIRTGLWSVCDDRTGHTISRHRLFGQAVKMAKRLAKRELAAAVRAIAAHYPTPH